MGWTYTYKPDSENLVSFVTRQLKSSDVQVISACARGRVVYAAVQVADKSIIGVVVLTSKSRSGGIYSQGYKLLPEDMGPYETKCPLYILNTLTKTDSVISLEWRAACREHRFPDYDKARKNLTLKETTL